MTKDITIYDNNAELINEQFEEKLSIEELSNLIEVFPESSYARIYNNKMFETSNFLIKINNNWLIWLDEKCEFDEWELNC